MSDDEIHFLCNILLKQRRNLSILKLQAADFTNGERPLWLSNAIIDTDQEIRNTEKQIRNLGHDPTKLSESDDLLTGRSHSENTSSDKQSVNANWQRDFEQGKYQIEKMKISLQDINLMTQDVMQYLNTMDNELDRVIDQIKIDKRSTILYLQNTIFIESIRRFDGYSAGLMRENRQNRQALNEADRCLGGYMLYEEAKIPIHITEVQLFTIELDKLAGNATLLSNSLSKVCVIMKGMIIESITTPKFSQSINLCTYQLNELGKFLDDLSDFGSKLSQIIKNRR